MLHNTAFFWEIFLTTKAPQIVETDTPLPVTVMIKEELDEDSLMQETIYLSSSYHQRDEGDRDEILPTVGSDMEDVFAVDGKPDANVLNLPGKKEPGFCDICFTGKEALIVRFI